MCTKYKFSIKSTKYDYSTKNSIVCIRKINCLLIPFFFKQIQIEGQYFVYSFKYVFVCIRLIELPDNTKRKAQQSSALRR